MASAGYVKNEFLFFQNPTNIVSLRNLFLSPAQGRREFFSRLRSGAFHRVSFRPFLRFLSLGDCTENGSMKFFAIVGYITHFHFVIPLLTLLFTRLHLQKEVMS